jgi:hypothetical protein
LEGGGEGELTVDVFRKGLRSGPRSAEDECGDLRGDWRFKAGVWGKKGAGEINTASGTCIKGSNSHTKIKLRITQMSGGVKAQASPLILQVSPSVLGINPRNSTPEWHKFPGAGGTFLRICRPMTGGMGARSTSGDWSRESLRRPEGGANLVRGVGWR